MEATSRCCDDASHDAHGHPMEKWWWKALLYNSSGTLISNTVQGKYTTWKRAGRSRSKRAAPPWGSPSDSDALVACDEAVQSTRAGGEGSMCQEIRRPRSKWEDITGVSRMCVFFYQSRESPLPSSLAIWEAKSPIAKNMTDCRRSKCPERGRCRRRPSEGTLEREEKPSAVASPSSLV